MNDTSAPALSGEQLEKQRIREFFRDVKKGTYVEVGANDPTAETSQTWHLEQAGWTGLLIEPIVELCELARVRRPASKIVNAACTSPENVGTVELKIPVVASGTITAHAGINPELDQSGYDKYEVRRVAGKTLDSILEGAGVSGIDLLSIDVEGTELDVLRGFNLQRHQPRLIVLEDKLVFLDKHRYLVRNGYRLLRRTGFNNWYVPRSNTTFDPLKDRLRLLNKMYPSLPFRKLKEFLKRKKKEWARN